MPCPQLVSTYYVPRPKSAPTKKNVDVTVCSTPKAYISPDPAEATLLSKSVVTTVHHPSETPQSPKPAAPCPCVPSCSIHIPRNNLTNRQSAVIEGCVMSTVSAANVRGAPEADRELKNSVAPMCPPPVANILPKQADSTLPPISQTHCEAILSSTVRSSSEALLALKPAAPGSVARSCVSNNPRNNQINYLPAVSEGCVSYTVSSVEDPSAVQVEANQDQKSTIDPPDLQPEAFTESKTDLASRVCQTEDHSEQQHDLAGPGPRTSFFQDPPRPKIPDLASLVRVAKSSPSHVIDVVSLGSGARISAPSAHRPHSHQDRPQKCVEAVMRQTTGPTAPLGCVPQTPHNTTP